MTILLDYTPLDFNYYIFDTLQDVIRHYDIQVANDLIVPEVNANIANELDAGGFIALGLSVQQYTDLDNFILNP